MSTKFNPKRFAPKIKDPYKYDPAEQVEGLTKRLEGSGVDTESELDKRNWFEKMTNLTPDQNILFDALELINRPQRALFGGIKAAQDGGEFGEGFKAGLSRNEDSEYGNTQFKEILHNMGLDDSENKFGLDDVLGFAGEILLDPMDLPLIPLTGGASAIAKATDMFQDATKALDAAQTAGRSAREIAKLTDRVHEASKLVDAAKTVKLRSGLRASARAASTGISKTFKMADSGITKGLKLIDAKKTANIIKNGGGEALEILQKGGTYLEKYGDFKKGIQSVFDATKRLPKNIWEKTFKGRGATNLSDAQLRVAYEDYLKKYDEFIKVNPTAQALGETEFSKMITKSIEMTKYKPTLTGAELFQEFEYAFLTEDMMNVYDSFFFDKGIDMKDVFKKTTLENGVDAYVPESKEMFNEFKSRIRKKDLLKEKSIEGIQEVESELSLGFLANGIKDRKEQKKILQEFRNVLDTVIEISTYDDLDTVLETYLKLVPDEVAAILAESPHLDQGILKYVELGVEKDLFYTSMDAPRFYSEADIAEVTRFLGDKNVNDFVEESNMFLRNMLSKIDENFALMSDDYAKVTNLAGMPDGYIKHSQTEAYKKFMNQQKLGKSPNVNEFSGRKYKMSAYEANLIAEKQKRILFEDGDLSEAAKEFFESAEGFSFFEESFRLNTDDFIDAAPKWANKIAVMDEVFLKSFLLDRSLIRPFEAGQRVPLGYTTIDKRNLVAQLNRFSPYLQDSKNVETIKGLLPETGSILVEANMLDQIGMLGDKNNTTFLIGMLDKVNNLFKKTKLLSPGFQLRNLTGNYTNIWLAGMPPQKINEGLVKADKIIRQGDDLLRKVQQGIKLTVEEQRVYDLYEKFLLGNFDKVGQDVWEIPEHLRKNTKDKKKLNAMEKVMAWNNEANQALDRRFRLALLEYAESNPGLYARAGYTDSVEFVRRTMYDPNNLSYYERVGMKRAIPFYTFAKSNAMFQMSNVLTSTKRYKDLNKTVRALWDFEGINFDELEDYKRENMWIPMPGSGDGNEYVALKVNLPAGELGELFSDPMRKIFGGMSPAIRAPFEAVMNKQMFTGMDIQEFEGQRGYIFPEIGRKSEYVLSQTGLDVPLAMGYDIAKTGIAAARGEVSSLGGGLNQAFGRSMTSTGSLDRARTSRSYDELREIEDLMKYYKQKNVPILTIAEIQNNNTNLERVSASLKSLRRRYQ